MAGFVGVDVDVPGWGGFLRLLLRQVVLSVESGVEEIGLTKELADQRFMGKERIRFVKSGAVL